MLHDVTIVCWVFYFLSGSLRPEVSSLFPGLPSGPFSDCALNPAHKTYPANSFFRCECLGSFYFSNHTNCSGSVSDQHAKQTRAATQFREKHKILGRTTKYGLFYSPLCAQHWFPLTLQPSSLKSISSDCAAVLFEIYFAKKKSEFYYLKFNI